jgi:hypothetical protein
MSRTRRIKWHTSGTRPAAAFSKRSEPPMPKIEEGDEVLLRARVETIWDQPNLKGKISVYIHGNSQGPQLIDIEDVEKVIPKPKRPPLYDKPD